MLQGMCSSFIEKLADNLKKMYSPSIERVMCHAHDWTELTCTDSGFYLVAGVKSEEDQRRVLNNFCSFSSLRWISSIEAVHWKKTCSQIKSIFHVDHNIGPHLNLRLCFHLEANLVERKPSPFEMWFALSILNVLKDSACDRCVMDCNLYVLIQIIQEFYWMGS